MRPPESYGKERVDMSEREYGCGEIIAVLDEYLDGEVDADTASAVEKHVAGCKSCAAALEEKRELRRLFADAAEDPPDTLHDSVMAAVRADAVSKRREFIRRFTSVAAVVVLAVGLTAAVWIAVSSGITGTKGDRYNMSAVADGAPPFHGDDEMVGGVGNEAGNEPGNEPGNGECFDKPEDTAPSGNVGDLNLNEERLKKVFETFGGGYAGGNVVIIDCGDASEVEALADSFGADFDGVSFVLPYSENAWTMILTEAERIGVVVSGFCGETDGETCIIAVFGGAL